MKMNQTLAELSSGRNNNLNLIRFVAACFVIISHSYALTKMGGNEDFCYILTGGGFTLGGVAVSIFFFYAGFLILKSMERIKEGIPYFKARILRIIPPLAFVTVMLAFVFGPILSTKDFVSYFTDIGTYKYLLNSVLVLVHNLPGVFEGNFHGPAVNGSLWTLPVEFICYILCFVFYKCGFVTKAKWTILPVFTLYLCADYFLSGWSPLLRSALRPMMLFYLGMLVYIYREKIKPAVEIAVVGVAVLVLGILICRMLSQSTRLLYDLLIMISFPPILIFLAWGGNRRSLCLQPR